MTTMPDDKQLPPDGRLDRATDPEYAAISSLAVLGMAFSLLGVLAVLRPEFIVLPAMGLVLGLAAVRKIRRSEGVLAGRGIAVGASLLGGLVLVGAASYHLHAWLSESRVYEDLSSRSLEITDDLLAGRYEKVYNMLPEEFRRQEGRGPEELRAHIAPALKDAGSVVRRSLMSLQIVRLEDGTVFAPAKVHVELERRYVEFKIVFMESPSGTWNFVGVGAGETWESQVKFQPPEPEGPSPPEKPPPAPQPEKPPEKPPPPAAKP